MGRLIALSLCVVLAGMAPEHAIAQSSSRSPQTRAEVLQRARESKRQSAIPYQPTTLERGMRAAEERLAPLLVGRDGVHWKLGSLTTGSGFAYGTGYRHRRLLDREGALNVWAAGSLKRYWAAEASFAMPSLAAGRLMLGVRARRQSYPQEDFFGVGPESRRGDHTSFHISNTLVGGVVGFRPAPKLTLGGGLEFSHPDLRPGRNTRVPAIHALFGDSTAPGLGSDPTFLRTNAFLDVDYREPKNARRGGWYRLEASRFAEETDAFTFNRVELDLRQYASILGERRVFAVRLFASTSDPIGGARVPFYWMPALGGHDSLRGFRDYRFRGPHAILTQTEYRFEVWSGLDAALFYDAGKVAVRRADLNLKRLEDAYGFGFRFNTDNGTILRIDAGFGSRDGKHLYIVFGDVF